MYFKVNEKNEREDGFYCKIQVLPNNFKIGDEGIVFEDVPCIKKFNKKSKKKKCEWFNHYQCDCKPLRMNPSENLICGQIFPQKPYLLFLGSSCRNLCR